MATYLNSVASTAAAASKYVPPLKGAQLCSLTQVITVVAGDLTLNNTMDVGWLPKGAIVVDAVMHVTDMDTGAGALVFDLGPTTNPDAYIDGLVASAAATGRAGNVAGAAATMASEAGVALTADTKVIVTVATAPSTAAGGTILVSVQYVV